MNIRDQTAGQKLAEYGVQDELDAKAIVKRKMRKSIITKQSNFRDLSKLSKIIALKFLLEIEYNMEKKKILHKMVGYLKSKYLDK